jgi:hypothetical protein
MTHDPLCEWSTPCVHAEDQQHSRDTENLAVPDATYCWICGADCHCDLITKVREDMLAKCIEIVEALPDVADDAREADLRQMYCSCEEWDCYCEHRGKAQAVLSLRALQEKDCELRVERDDWASETNAEALAAIRALQEKS